MKREIRNIAWIVGFVAAFMAVHYSQQEPENILATVAQKENHGLPRQIDAVTRLDNVTADASQNQFSYNYTLLTQEAEQLVMKNQEARKTQILAKACSAEPELREHGTTLYYNYKNLVGGKVTTLEIRLKECK